MICTHNMQASPQKKPQVLQWENQNQFLQERHGSRTEALKETILVAVHPNNNGFKLLSWVVNTAARPGDSVFAFHLRNIDAKVRNLSGTDLAHEHEAAVCQFNILKDICDAKQVELHVRFAVGVNEKLELMEEVMLLNATMLVVSPKLHHKSWKIQKKAGDLARRAPVGCSVVVVKDYKVLFYKDNGLKDANELSSCSQELDNGASLWKIPFGTLQRQFSCTSSPLWSQAKDSYDFDALCLTDNKIWPFHSGEISPRGVLDGIGLSSESDISSPLSRDHSLTHSLSRKGLLACVSLNEKSEGYNIARRCGGIQRSSTFPPASYAKKFSGPLDCTLMRSSVKSYVSSLWSTDSMSHDPYGPDLLSSTQRSWRCFSFEELAFATDHFHADNMVGRGGHSEVYKGTLFDGRLVAIKKLLRSDSEDFKPCDFLTELGIIGHVSHPNTTPLVGFCVEEGLHLIFDFSLHGSLAELLHGAHHPVLEWSVRYKVAVGTACGLHYLHTGCPKRIIHRDIKASNILLGPDFEAQISDFGLAKWLPENVSQLNVFPVEGTFGYLAPEYFMHGVVHERTDVFAFGVLLLELITGRLPIDNSQQSLVIWAKPLLESSRTEDLVDPRLAGAYNHQELQSMVLVASLCIQPSANCRPDMAQVLELLSNEHLDSQTFSYSLPLSQSDYFQDSCDEGYSPSNYLRDLSRHREIALQF